LMDWSCMPSSPKESISPWSNHFALKGMASSKRA
jgi:hypothetical protein